MRQGFPVTVAELLVSGGRPLPPEAAALVLGVCSRVTPGPRHVVAAPISASSVFVEADGTVSVAGGEMVEDDQTVSLLGHLLLEMLRSGGAAGQRPAARLEALALRAAAVSVVSGLTLPRFASEVRRFAPEDPAGAVKGLFDRWRRGGREPAAQDGRVPETLRRLLPEADLAAMAGLTPTLHGGEVRAGFIRAGRRLVLTAATLLLLSAAGATWFLWGDRESDPQPAPSTRSSAGVSQPARELLPGGTPAARPTAATDEKARPATKATGSRLRRVRADPD
ncbi:MAG: hypothetical protein EHM24_14785 [Acidobacteria bacterium]|nr:MAG: hypothetical protein EHM24_14785 [Acidobacteriota bacterium]